MEIFIYFYKQLPIVLDELEDALEAALAGVGKVTGVGTGTAGSNIDLAVDGSVSEVEALSLVRKTLEQFELPRSSKIVIGKNEYLLE